MNPVIHIMFWVMRVALSLLLAALLLAQPTFAVLI